MLRLEAPVNLSVGEVRPTPGRPSFAKLETGAPTVFGRGGFGPGHDRIITVFSGAGKTSSAFTAAAKGISSTFKNAALVSFIFGTATAVAEWKEDAQKDGYDLTGTLITIAIKTIVTAALTALAVAGILALAMFSFSAAVPVIFVGAITVSAGILVSYGVESVDKSLGRTLTNSNTSTEGTSSIVSAWIRSASYQAQARIKDSWIYLMYQMTRDYQEIEF